MRGAGPACLPVGRSADRLQRISGEVADEEECRVYVWMWRRLPGVLWVKILWTMVIFVLVVFALFQYVFPALEPYVPFSGSGSMSN
jgi:hypothetical protein